MFNPSAFYQTGFFMYDLLLYSIQFHYGLLLCLGLCNDDVPDESKISLLHFPKNKYHTRPPAVSYPTAPSPKYPVSLSNLICLELV